MVWKKGKLEKLPRKINETKTRRRAKDQGGIGGGGRRSFAEKVERRKGERERERDRERENRWERACSLLAHWCTGVYDVCRVAMLNIPTSAPRVVHLHTCR